MEREGEKQYPRVGVGVIVQRDGKVLLGKRKSLLGQNTYSIAGGHLEYGETIEECAHRELEEETGLKALSIRIGPWANNMIDGSKHYVTLFVFVDAFEGEPEIREPEKCEEWKWYSWSELPSPLFPTVESLAKMIRTYR